MAISEQVNELRRLIAEPINEEPYTDERLGEILDTNAGKTLMSIAGQIWREKAAGYAELTDISEGGSSRSGSKLYQQALAMAETFDPKVTETAATTVRPTNRRIDRF